MKSPEMTAALDNLSTSLFGRDRSSCLLMGRCVCCGNEATSFRDALSAREFKISGMCQECQDKTFGGDE